MFRATHLPSLSILIDDQLTRDHEKIAKHVGVSLRSLQRYIAEDFAPRAVMLALFYESRWGYSVMGTNAHNDAVLSAQIAAGLTRENAALRVRIARLENLASAAVAENDKANDSGFGSANEPFFKTL